MVFEYYNTCDIGKHCLYSISEEIPIYTYNINRIFTPYLIYIYLYPKQSVCVYIVRLYLFLNPNVIQNIKINMHELDFTTHACTCTSKQASIWMHAWTGPHRKGNAGAARHLIWPDREREAAAGGWLRLSWLDQPAAAAAAVAAHCVIGLDRTTSKAHLEKRDLTDSLDTPRTTTLE